METSNFHTAEPDWLQLLDKPRIYVDLTSGGRDGDYYIVTLNKQGTLRDLQQSGVTLQEGIELDLWSDDGDENGHPDPLIFHAVVRYDASWNTWVAVADWNGFQHASELRQLDAQEPLLV